MLKSTQPSSTHSQSGSISGQLDGVFAALFTLGAWTAAPMFVKYFASDIDFWTSNGWRYSFAALCWFPLVVYLFTRGRLPKGIWKKAAIPAFFNSLGQVCFVGALYLIAAGIVTFGLRAHIIFVAIGAAILFPQERALIRKPKFLIAGGVVLLGVCGVLLLGEATATTPATGIGIGSADTGDAIAQAHDTPASESDDSLLQTLGITLSIFAGLFFACYGLSVRKCMSGIGPMTSFGVVSLYTAGAMLILMLIFGKDHGATAVTALTGTQFMLLVLSALIPIAFAHVAYYHGIAKLGVATVSGIVQLQPFTVSAVGFLLFREVLTFGQVIAGAVAIAGAFVMLAVQQRHARTERAQREATSETGG